MLIENADQAANRLAEAFALSRQAVAFTGAGISTESGVPDYRSPGSPWMRYKPIAYAAFLADPAQRVEAWRRKFAMDDIYAGAQPSRGHRALSHLSAAGRLHSIVTQNIDNLHQLSGVPASRLIELHGNGTYAACLSCAQRHELREVRRVFEEVGEAPACRECGGIVKSATISFGQALPPAVLRAAREAALACDLFVVIGSSLVVHPAASLPLQARRNGATLVILNGEATPLDGEADLVLRGDIGTILQPLIAAHRQ